MLLQSRSPLWIQNNIGPFFDNNGLVKTPTPAAGVLRFIEKSFMEGGELCEAFNVRVGALLSGKQIRRCNFQAWLVLQRLPQADLVFFTTEPLVEFPSLVMSLKLATWGYVLAKSCK